MRKHNIAQVSTEEIREVLEFVDAQDALQEFKSAHPAFFTQLDQLVDRYNTTLEQAEQVVRQRGVKCGPFDAYQVSVKYDPTALYNAVGRDVFLAVGGKITNETVYDVDKGRLEAAIAAPSSKIPKEVVDVIRKEQLAYHKPGKLSVP